MKLQLLAVIAYVFVGAANSSVGSSAVVVDNPSANNENDSTGSNLRGGRGGGVDNVDLELLDHPRALQAVTSDAVQPAIRILPSGRTEYTWTINKVIHSALCGASTTNVKSATWTGIEENVSTKKIQWNSVTVTGGTLGESDCTYTRTNPPSPSFVEHYLGTTYGVLPTNIALPMFTDMKRFTIRHKEPALCAGSTTAVTHWYGKQCEGSDDSTTMIEWQYMESTQVGDNVIAACAGTPQWERGYNGDNAGTTGWLGYCGISATHASFLPLKFDYVYTQKYHTIPDLCADPNTNTESIWIGEACANGGYKWDKVVTPLPTNTDPTKNCAPRVPQYDRTITTGNNVLAQTFVDQYMGNSCTVGPTDPQLTSLPP